MMKKLFLPFLLLTQIAFGETKIFTQTINQSFSGSQSADDALASAVAKAKRGAIEKVGTYIETITELRNEQISSDTILAMAGGISQTEILSQKNYIDGNAFGVEVIVQCIVDTENIQERVKSLIKDKQHIQQLEESKKREAELLAKAAELEKENKNIAQSNYTKKQQLKEQFRAVKNSLNAEDYFYKGQALWDSSKGKYSNPILALEMFTKSIELDPNTAAYDNRGLVYVKLNRFDEAIKDYSKAIELDSNYADAYYNRGILYNKLNRTNEAIKDFTKAIQLDPNDADAYYNRGIGFYNKRNLTDEAIRDFTKAIQLDPKYADAYYNRGILYNKLNRTDESIRDYTKSIQIDPNKTDAYNNRGMVYNKLNRFDEAINDYSKAIELDQNFAMAFYNRGIIYNKLNRFDQAIRDFTKAIQLDPTYTDAYINRGNIYDDLNRTDEAISDYTKAIQLDTNDADAYNNRARVYYLKGDGMKSLKDAKRACSLGSCEGLQFLNSKGIR